MVSLAKLNAGGGVDDTAGQDTGLHVSTSDEGATLHDGHQNVFQPERGSGFSNLVF